MKAIRNSILLLLVAFAMTGCMRTVDQMYCLPKRSETYNNLQSAIDEAMYGLSYCAPLSGENQQSVQMADLDGDGRNEYLLFAKSSMDEKPLRILVFQNENGTFHNIDTLECSGSAFDQVEYVDLDGKGGVEIIVGRQVSDQAIRSVSVYSHFDGELMQLITVNYAKFVTADLNEDGLKDLFILCAGETETDNGIAELYSMHSGTIERYNEVNLSRPIDQLKRILVGSVDGGQAAIYTACAVGEASLVTDIFVLKEGLLTNLNHSDGSDTSVQTLRNFYVYANDIDNDSVVELPRLIAMQGANPSIAVDTNQLICWYAINAEGEEIVKMHTYHNFVGGWYVQLGVEWADRVFVDAESNEYTFYVWNEAGTACKKVATIYAFSGQNREAQAEAEGYVALYKTDTVIYAATLEAVATDYELNEEVIKSSFRLIQQEWKTGET